MNALKEKFQTERLGCTEEWTSVDQDCKNIENLVNGFKNDVITERMSDRKGRWRKEYSGKWFHITRQRKKRLIKKLRKLTSGLIMM